MSKKSARRKTTHAGESSRSARARLAEMRRREQLARRRRRLITGITTAVAILAAIAGGAWLIASRQNDSRAAEIASNVAAAGQGRRSMPPWPLPDDPADAAKAAGLRVAQMEYTAAHFHSHLDITVNGQAVPVPANIGIDPASQQMSELHTHDQRGVLHIEAPTNDRQYTLGQLFTEWRVRLDGNGIGGLGDTKSASLRAYVNGKPFTGNPATVQLTAHRQISLIYGPRDANDKPAPSYPFEPGE